jgi:hypothetical protein
MIYIYIYEFFFEKTKFIWSTIMNAKQISRCKKKTFETFKTMMKKMTNSENLAQN